MIQVSAYLGALEVSDPDEFSEEFLFDLSLNLNNSKYMRFSRHGDSKHDISSILEFYEQNKRNGGRYFQVKLISTEEIVGTFTMRPHERNRCEIGILIFSKSGNQGIGSAVWKKAIELGRQQNYSELIAGCHIQNMPMRRIMEKAGMILDESRNYPEIVDANPERIYFFLKA